MIFPNLIHENIVQVNDKTRLDASGCFATPDEGEITKVEISFNQVDYINIFKAEYPEKWFLDFAFDSDGDKSVYVKVTTENGDKESEYTLSVITEEDDKLFSNDAQLYAYETELKIYLPKGKNSFKYAHRESQKEIIRYLDGEGIVKNDKSPFIKDDLVANAYVSEWSAYLTLLNIFEDIKVKEKDVFETKKVYYSSKLTKAIKNAKIRLDYDGNGEVDDTEVKNAQNKFLTR